MPYPGLSILFLSLLNEGRNSHRSQSSGEGSTIQGTQKPFTNSKALCTLSHGADGEA